MLFLSFSFVCIKDNEKYSVEYSLFRWNCDCCHDRHKWRINERSNIICTSLKISIPLSSNVCIRKMATKTILNDPGIHMPCVTQQFELSQLSYWNKRF